MENCKVWSFCTYYISFDSPQRAQLQGIGDPSHIHGLRKLGSGQQPVAGSKSLKYCIQRIFAEINGEREFIMTVIDHRSG